MPSPAEFRTAVAARLLTIQVAAQQLAVSRGMLYNLMERGDLAYVKIGRARRIPAEEVDRLINASLVSRPKGAISKSA